MGRLDFRRSQESGLCSSPRGACLTSSSRSAFPNNGWQSSLQWPNGRTLNTYPIKGSKSKHRPRARSSSGRPLVYRWRPSLVHTDVWSRKLSTQDSLTGIGESRSSKRGCHGQKHSEKENGTTAVTASCSNNGTLKCINHSPPVLHMVPHMYSLITRWRQAS